MGDFIKNVMDWILEKEADAAKNCHAKPEDIDKQINMIKNKKESLEKRYNDEMAEFEHIINKLHSIKAASMKCHTQSK